MNQLILCDSKKEEFIQLFMEKFLLYCKVLKYWSKRTFVYVRIFLLSFVNFYFNTQVITYYSSIVFMNILLIFSQLCLNK